MAESDAHTPVAASQFGVPQQFFFDLIETINSAETLEQLLDCVPTAVPKLIVSYHHFGAVGAFDYKESCQFHAYNVPEDIVNYLDRHRKPESNPAVVVVLSKGQSVWLSELIDDPYILEVGHDKLTRATMDLTGDALCIPLYGPGTRSGYMFVAFGKAKVECDDFVVHRIETLAQKFHVRYCLMLEALHKQVNLTSREAEVLELITYGKSNAEIATILGISRNTVGGHVKRIFLKLDVTDRVSAAMRAQTLKIQI